MLTEGWNWDTRGFSLDDRLQYVFVTLWGRSEITLVVKGLIFNLHARFAHRTTAFALRRVQSLEHCEFFSCGFAGFRFFLVLSLHI